MKKYLRKNDKPLEQLIKRLDEEHRSDVSRNSIATLDKGIVRLFQSHNDGPLPDNCIGQQFKSAERGDMWSVTCNEPDNCVFLSDIMSLLLEILLNMEI